MTANRNSASPWRSVGIAMIVAAACALEDQEYAAIDAWLNCDHCINGERAAVEALGNDAVPTLALALRGPSQGRRDLMRRKFEESHRQYPAGVPQTQYVNQLLANYVATYQKRSALSLGDIDSERARDELRKARDSAGVRGYRPDVVRVIRTALAIAESPPFDGSIRPASVRFADTVTVSRGYGSTVWDGDEEAVLAAAPFAPSDLLVFQASDSLKFLAVADAGTHALSVGNLGPSSATQVAPLTIRSIVDANDRATRSCVTHACTVDSSMSVGAAQLPQEVFLSLWRTPPRPDTVDVFRFRPTFPTPISARLDWPSSANLDLRWRRCSPYVMVGNDSGATMSNPESTAVIVPAGECWVLLVMLVSAGTEPEFARLRLATQ